MGLKIFRINVSDIQERGEPLSSTTLEVT